MKRFTCCITPRLVSNSAVGLTLIAELMSCNAANVSLICRFTTARPSRAGTKSAQSTSFQEQLHDKTSTYNIITSHHDMNKHYDLSYHTLLENPSNTRYICQAIVSQKMS